MLYMLLILTILQTSLSHFRFKKHVENSAFPLFYEEPTYNISRWVKVLNLQQCVFVEIGEKYCAMFVEVRSRETKEVEEYFLGICDLETLFKWKLCSVPLEKKRPRDCRFKKGDVELEDVEARVHRRLCDVTGLSFYADRCDCKKFLDDQHLRPVTGFPTCFLSPLPQSICFPKNVCGTNFCTGMTVLDQIHSVKCDPSCSENRPFCEDPGLESSIPSKVKSFWSDWKKTECVDGPCPSSQFNVLEAECIDSKTGNGEIDCLGPGTSCCPANIEKCRCNVFVEDGVLKVIRQYFKDENPKEFFERRSKRYYFYPNLLPSHRTEKRNKNYMNRLEKNLEKRLIPKNILKNDGLNQELLKKSEDYENSERNNFAIITRSRKKLDNNVFKRWRRKENEKEYTDDDDDDDDDHLEDVDGNYDDANAEDIALEEEIEKNTEPMETTTEELEKGETLSTERTEVEEEFRNFFDDNEEDTSQSSENGRKELFIPYLIFRLFETFASLDRM